MTPELKVEWMRCQRAFIHATGSPMRASGLLLGCALGFVIESGHGNKDLLSKIKTILAVSGVRIDA